jgi:hypothetical protein
VRCNCLFLLGAIVDYFSPLYSKDFVALGIRETFDRQSLFYEALESPSSYMSASAVTSFVLQIW